MKKSIYKILIPLVILVGILSLIELGFVIDSNNTKSKNAPEIAQNFVNFLENKEFYRANHLMCFGQASLNFWEMYLHLMSYSQRSNNEKLAFQLTKKEYRNNNQNISNNSKNLDSDLIYSLKIYPQSKNPDNYSNSFGLVMGNGENSSCIFLQGG